MRNPPSRRQYVLLVVGFLTVAAVYAGLIVVGERTETGTARPSAPSGPTSALYVSPAGSDTNDGTERSPLATIQAALQKATPGTVVNLAPGTYREQLTTVHDGAPGAPITIKGPETGKERSGRYRAVVYGTGRVFSIDNSYYTLDGFTIDGQEQLSNAPYPTTIQAADAFKDSVRGKVEDGRLVYVGAADDSKDLTGITISNMFLNGAGGECVRLRNNAHDNLITDSVIQYCGMFGKGDDDERATYHNGEGVYIGTSPGSDSQPMHANDTSSHNRVVGNTIRTFGSECFDVKENAHDNVLEGNDCSANTETTDSSAATSTARLRQRRPQQQDLRQRGLRREDPERRRRVRQRRQRHRRQPDLGRRRGDPQDQGQGAAGPDLRQRDHRTACERRRRLHRRPRRAVRGVVGRRRPSKRNGW